MVSKDTADLHERQVLSAFGYTDQVILGPRPRQSHQRQDSSQPSIHYLPPQIIPSGDDPLDAPDYAVTREIHYDPIPDEALTEGECPGDYANVFIVPPQSIQGNSLAESIYRRKQAAATAIAQRIRYWWDRSTIPLLAYVSMLTRADLTDPRHSLSWLLANTGQRFESLLDLEFLAEDTLPSSSLGLNLYRKSLIYRSPAEWVGWKPQIHGSLLRDCERSTDCIEIPPPLKSGSQSIRTWNAASLCSLVYRLSYGRGSS